MDPQVTNIRVDETGAAADAVQPSPPSPKAAPAIVYVTDKLNRRIGLKKLKPSERFSLEETAQTKTPSGEMQAIFAATVFSIDEEGMTPIRSRKELLARMDELGDEGLIAIVPECMKLYGIDLSEKDVETVKNS